MRGNVTPDNASTPAEPQTSVGENRSGHRADIRSSELGIGTADDYLVTRCQTLPRNGILWYEVNQKVEHEDTAHP